MKKTKQEIADEMYDEDLEYLTAGQKAAVTKAFNAQKSTPSRRASSKAVIVKLGRIGNGVKESVLSKGQTVGDLLDQTETDLDEDKESVTCQSTGDVADLDDELVNGETYIIAAEIKSA